MTDKKSKNKITEEFCNRYPKIEKQLLQFKREVPWLPAAEEFLKNLRPVSLLPAYLPRDIERIVTMTCHEMGHGSHDSMPLRHQDTPKKHAEDLGKHDKGCHKGLGHDKR